MVKAILDEEFQVCLYLPGYKYVNWLHAVQLREGRIASCNWRDFVRGLQACLCLETFHYADLLHLLSDTELARSTSC